MTAGLLAYLARAVAGASVRFTAGLPGPGCRVFFANHASHLDFLVVWASLPAPVRRATRPVAAADYWRRGRLRRHLAGRVFRAVLVERGTGDGRAAIERCAGALRDGDSLILFPEGTRGDGTEIAPFKPGLYHLGRAHPGLELVPVYLENLNRVLPKGEAVPVPLISRVVFGAPLRVDEAEDRDAFLERARSALVALA